MFFHTSSVTKMVIQTGRGGGGEGDSIVGGGVGGDSIVFHLRFFTHSAYQCDVA